MVRQLPLQTPEAIPLLVEEDGCAGLILVEGVNKPFRGAIFKTRRAKCMRRTELDFHTRFFRLYPWPNRIPCLSLTVQVFVHICNWKTAKKVSV